MLVRLTFTDSHYYGKMAQEHGFLYTDVGDDILFGSGAFVRIRSVATGEVRTAHRSCLEFLEDGPQLQS